MMVRHALLITSAALLLGRCMPATARATSRATVADSIACTASALGSMGYDVLAADDRNRFVQAQRLKHATNPFSGAMDADRITVFVDAGENATSMRVIGETIGTLTALRFPSMTLTRGGGIRGANDAGNRLVRKWTSREVAGDTESVAHACAE